jgi:hypothetical protein
LWQLFAAALTLVRFKSRVRFRDSVRRANCISTASDVASAWSSTRSPGVEEWVKGLTVALVARPPPMLRLNSGGTCDSRFIEAVMSRSFNIRVHLKEAADSFPIRFLTIPISNPVCL